MLQMSKHYESEFKKKIVHFHLKERKSLKSLAAEYSVSHASISNCTANNCIFPCNLLKEDAYKILV